MSGIHSRGRFAAKSAAFAASGGFGPRASGRRGGRGRAGGARLAAMAEPAGRADAAPVRRAMMNLRSAAIQRMTRAGTGAETAFAIAALLDEAAQKIERS